VVPTLVHNGAVIIESTIINEYLDDVFADPPLHPADPAGKAAVRLWTKQLDDGLHADTGVLSTGIAFRYQKLAKGADEVEALISNVPDPAKRARVRENIYQGAQSEQFRQAVLRFDALLARMETALGAGPWLAGNSFTLADIAYAPYVTRLDHLQLAGMWQRRPRLAAWYARARERRSYREALTDWLNPKYLELMSEKGRQEWPRVEEILAGSRAAA
jgi:glutathione S-transferase